MARKQSTAPIFALTLLLLFNENLAVVGRSEISPSASPLAQPTTLPAARGSTQGSLQPAECTPRCDARCSATQYKKPCKFFCLKCCAKCLCVPPGTYGNKQFCPCYNDWKTKRGGPKCP